MIVSSVEQAEYVGPTLPSPKDKSDFRTELAQLINKYSMENGSNTPDFALARYMTNCLEAYEQAIQDTLRWQGKMVPEVPPIPGQQGTTSPTD